MSIIAIRDCTKNMPSRVTSNAALKAKRRLGHSRRASRYTSGTTSVPKKRLVSRQPHVP